MKSSKVLGFVIVVLVTVDQYSTKHALFIIITLLWAKVYVVCEHDYDWRMVLLTGISWHYHSNIYQATKLAVAITALETESIPH